MSMKLSDLSDINRRILVVLKDIHCGGRRHIAELAGLQPNQVSPALNRLEVMGFIDHPGGPGMGWTISREGYALFGLRPPVAAEPAPESEAEEELKELAPENLIKPEPEVPFPDSCGPEFAKPEPEPTPVAGPFDAGKIADIMTAMEIELALEQLRRVSLVAAIPSRTARVYREILSALPPVLADALAPLTALVDANAHLAPGHLAEHAERISGPRLIRTNPGTPDDQQTATG